MAVVQAGRQRSAQAEKPVDLVRGQRPVGLVGGGDQRRGEFDLVEKVTVLELDVERISGHAPSPLLHIVAGGTPMRRSYTQLPEGSDQLVEAPRTVKL